MVLCILQLVPQRFLFDYPDKLAQLWVAEGFVEATDENDLTAVERGQQYFDELLSCSFFQPEPMRVSPYVIHDLLHDLAEKVSQGHCFRIEANGLVDIPPIVVHLSVVGELLMSLLDALELVNLRTFMNIGCDCDDLLLNVITDDMFEMFAKFGRLRAMHFRSRVHKLPSTMRQLKHLWYVEVHRVEELPRSLSRLYCPQFLLLPDHNIKRVPKSFNKLVSMEYFFSSDFDAELMLLRILEIGKLNLLRTLSLYNVESSREFGMGQLRNLKQLRGSLRIEGLENVKDKMEATDKPEKEHLESLLLHWRSETNRDGRADEEVFFLGELEIRGCQGAKIPSWMLNN